MKIRELIEQLNEYSQNAEIEIELDNGIVSIDNIEPSGYMGIVYLVCDGRLKNENN